MQTSIAVESTADQRTRDGEALADVFDDGRLWDRHKAATQTEALQGALREGLGDRYASEVNRCSTSLLLYRDLSTADLGIRPFESCRRRWCPLCSWLKTRARWALFLERVPGLIEQHSPVRWLMLTLTVCNCAIVDLPATVDRMFAGYRALTNPKSRLGREWPATGWLRALEITFPRSGEAHPHIHSLLAVRPSYFTRGYIRQAEWAQRWKQACKLNYNPIVDVRRVKPLSPEVKRAVGPALAEAFGGLREVSKYIVKPADIADNPDAAKGLMLLKNRRFLDGGGWLRGVLRAHSPDPQLELPVIEDVATFVWRAVEQRYRRG